MGEVCARQHLPTTTAMPTLASSLVTAPASDSRCAWWQVRAYSSCMIRRRFRRARARSHVPIPRPAPASTRGPFATLCRCCEGDARRRGADLGRRRSQPAAEAVYWRSGRAPCHWARRLAAQSGCRSRSARPLDFNTSGSASRALGAAAVDPAAVVLWGVRRRVGRLWPREEAAPRGDRLQRSCAAVRPRGQRPFAVGGAFPSASGRLAWDPKSTGLAYQDTTKSR